MILKGFKEKSNKKHLNKLLTQRKVSAKAGKIESLGVILNIDEFDNFEVFNDLANTLNVRSNRFKIIAYSANNEVEIDKNTWESCFNPDDFGWRGTIKNKELESFLNKEFDALISYYTIEDTALKLLTAKCNAQFKIGVMQTDARLNDLIIKTDLKQFNVFKAELHKYLTTLNKIKNEQ